MAFAKFKILSLLYHSATDQANQVANQNKKMKSVTMVAWSLDDALAITAVSDLTLKIWDANKGSLISNLSGHEDEIFVLEPHPYAMNLLLTAAHDGHLIGELYMKLLSERGRYQFHQNLHTILLTTNKYI